MDERRSPPLSRRGILRQLGPGLIIAGSIVGSGELIATTKTGAEAGFTLLWLIILGCLIKVFVQIELGRYTIIQGRTTMEGLNEVPGPRLRVNWLLWYWLLMFIVSMFQLGGIIGGVGQAMSIVYPLTESGRAYNQHQDLEVRAMVFSKLQEKGSESASITPPAPPPGSPPESHDDVWWAAIVALITVALLARGRYGVIQAVSTILVAGFTLLSIANLLQLQALPDWRIHTAEVLEGLSFRFPPSDASIGVSPLATALATLGIIGVGATELIQYPYWCLEKGYARWTGDRDAGPEWAARARGWLRVLRWDAWCSAVVYTFATVVFYLLGAAVLGRVGLNPAGQSMIRTLSEMYVPVFGEFAQTVFLIGAVVVLYSTLFVSTASHARVCADAVRVFGLSRGDERSRVRWVRIFSAFFPIFFLFVYLFIRAPVALILASGIMQAIMLPMLGAAALFFRYRRGDARLPTGRFADVCLWLSTAALVVTGAWALWSRVKPWLAG